MREIDFVDCKGNHKIFSKEYSKYLYIKDNNELYKYGDCSFFEYISKAAMKYYKGEKKERLCVIYKKELWALFFM